MKKLKFMIVALMLAAVLSLTLAACNADGTPEIGGENGTSSAPVKLPDFDKPKTELTNENINDVIGDYFADMQETEEENPSYPGGDTPSTPGGDTPSTPGGDTPSTPGGGTGEGGQTQEPIVPPSITENIVKSEGFTSDNVGGDAYLKYVKDCVAQGYTIDGEYVDGDTKATILVADKVKYIVVTLQNGKLTAVVFEMEPPKTYEWATATELKTLQLTGLTQPSGTIVSNKATTSSTSKGRFDSLYMILDNASQSSYDNVVAQLKTLGFTLNQLTENLSESGAVRYNYSAYKTVEGKAYYCYIDYVSVQQGSHIDMQFCNYTQQQICEKGKTVGDLYSTAEIAIETQSVVKYEIGTGIKDNDGQEITNTGLRTDKGVNNILYSVNGVVTYDRFPEFNAYVYRQSDNSEYHLTNGGHNLAYERGASYLLASDYVRAYTAYINYFYMNSDKKTETGVTKTIVGVACKEISAVVSVIYSEYGKEDKVISWNAKFYLDPITDLLFGYESEAQSGEYTKSIYFTKLQTENVNADKYFDLPADGTKLTSFPTEEVQGESGLTDFPTPNGASGFYVWYNYEPVRSTNEPEDEQYVLKTRFRIFGLDATEFNAYAAALREYGFTYDTLSYLEYTLPNCDIVVMHVMNGQTDDGEEYREFYFTKDVFVPLELPTNLAITYTSKVPGSSTQEYVNLQRRVFFYENYLYYKADFQIGNTFDDYTAAVFRENGVFEIYNGDLSRLQRAIESGDAYSTYNQRDFTSNFLSSALIMYFMFSFDVDAENLTKTGSGKLLGLNCDIYETAYEKYYYCPSNGYVLMVENKAEGVRFKIDAIENADQLVNGNVPVFKADAFVIAKFSPADYEDDNYSNYVEQTYKSSVEETLAYLDKLSAALTEVTRDYAYVIDKESEIPVETTEIEGVNASYTDGENLYLTVDLGPDGELYIRRYTLKNGAQAFFGYSIGATYKNFYETFGDCAFTITNTNDKSDYVTNYTIDGNKMLVMNSRSAYGTFYEYTPDGVYSYDCKDENGVLTATNRIKNSEFAACNSIEDLVNSYIRKGFTLEYRLNEFEELGSETVDGHECTHYKGVVTHTGNSVLTEIFVDDQTGITMKLIEYVSMNGSKEDQDYKIYTYVLSSMVSGAGKLSGLVIA